MACQLRQIRRRAIFFEIRRSGEATSVEVAQAARGQVESVSR